METNQMALQCACTPVEDVRYDRTRDGAPATAVVRAIAASSDVDPASLSPLNDCIDADALNRLFAEGRSDEGPSGRILSFTMDGRNVFVRDDGRIRVCDPTGPADTSPVFD